MEEAVRIVQRHAKELQKQKELKIKQELDALEAYQKEVERECNVLAIIFCGMGLLTILAFAFEAYITFKVASL